LLVVAGGVFASALMAGAEVTVYPRHKEPNISAEFEATKVAQADGLSYELMTLEAEGERQVKASGEEVVTTQSVGTIFIYNSAQKEPMRLIANTRFESPDGLIFKIKDSVIVPGYTTSAAGQKIAGVAPAQVYADQPGQKHNIQPTKFTLPGFKGEPEYTTIYGESTSAFTGGFNDKKFIIEEAEMQTAQQALRTELRNSLLGRIDSEKPAGFVVFKDAVTFTYETLPSVAYGDNLATIKEKVLLRIPIFKNESFDAFLAQKAIPGFEPAPVKITDHSVLAFSYKNATTSSSDISNSTELAFNLVGKPQIVWVYDEAKLRADLVGANKTALTTVLGGYPSVERATAEIRPFWRSNFPSSIEEIKIIEVLTENVDK
jgi:hypothetical protein